MNEIKSHLSFDPSGLARVSGPLTLDSVAAVYGKAKAEAARGRHIGDLDLEAVSRVDSSGLALLLEWQSIAGRAGRTLHIRNAPPDLLSLASLCEASDLLTIDGRSRRSSAEELQSYAEQEAGP